MTDTSFAERLGAHRVVAGAIQQSLADRASIHVTQVHRYEAGSSSQPTLDVLRSLTQSISAASCGSPRIVEGSVMRLPRRGPLCWSRS